MFFAYLCLKENLPLGLIETGKRNLALEREEGSNMPVWNWENQRHRNETLGM